MTNATTTKSTEVRARIEPELKAEAESILKSIGLSTSELITMTMRQVVMLRGLPFTARIPNNETIAAIKEHEKNKKAEVVISYDSVDSMFTEIKNNS